MNKLQQILKLNLRKLTIPLLSLSLMAGCVGVFSGSLSAASLTIQSSITNSSTDDPVLPALGINFSGLSASPPTSTRLVFSDKIQSTLDPSEVYYMTGRLDEPCRGALINKIRAFYDAKSSASSGSQFGLLAFYADGLIVDSSSVVGGGSIMGISGVGDVFGMPQFDQLGVIAEWDNLNIPYSQKPGIAASVAGYDGSTYASLDNIKIEVTYDNSSCTPLSTSPDIFSTPPSNPTTINILGNDSGSNLAVSKIDGQTITPGQTITLTNGSGTVKLNNDGTITFTPTSGFTGESSFNYSITDGTNTVDTGAVKITVFEPGKGSQSSTVKVPNSGFVVVSLLLIPIGIGSITYLFISHKHKNLIRKKSER